MDLFIRNSPVPVSPSWEGTLAYTLGTSDTYPAYDGFTIDHYFTNSAGQKYQYQQASGYLTPQTITITSLSPQCVADLNLLNSVTINLAPSVSPINIKAHCCPVKSGAPVFNVMILAAVLAI
jgi:hypothetical protein